MTISASGNSRSKTEFSPSLSEVTMKVCPRLVRNLRNPSSPETEPRSSPGLKSICFGVGAVCPSGFAESESAPARSRSRIKAVLPASAAIDIAGGTVRAEGDLDFRGTLGVSKDVPVGFQQIRLQFDFDSDASEEQLATLLRLTERYCVVYQTLSRPAKIDVEYRLASG